MPEVTGYLTVGPVAPVGPEKHDITRYLEKREGIDTEGDLMPCCLRADILGVIQQWISGMCVRECVVPTPCMILY